jgi:L-iditol 2-dehydrogenase
MKTMVLTAIRQMALRDLPAPTIRTPHEVLLRIGAVGVCGSDLHYYTTGRIGSQVVEFPFPVGHECSATVAAVGSAVTRVRVGDRVAVDPAVSCGQCDQCRAGRRHTCRKLVFMGCPGQIPGCLGEYYVMPEESLYVVPPGMTHEQAALIEPLSIGLYAARLAGCVPGATLAILGAGPIGLSVMAAARALGARRIAVSEPLAYRRAAAAAHGADLAVHPQTEGVPALLRFAPDLFDVVLECCGQQAAIDQALELLKPGGKLMIVGIPQEPRLSFSAELMRRRELSLQNVRRQNDCTQAAIDLLASGRLQADFMITHHVRLEQTPDAFELVDRYADGVIKAMVHIGD